MLQALVDSGEAKPGLRKLAVTHAGGKRYVLAGLGKREAFDAERARVAAASVVTRARELGTRSLCWELPHHVGDAEAGGFVEGTLLAAYAYRAYKTKPDEDGGLEQLALSAHHDVSEAVGRAAIAAVAANAARDLQHAPANEMTPTRLAERAHELAAELGSLTVETMGRAEIEAAGMGAFAGVARGSHEEPQLITLRYAPEDATGPVLGLVGKAVTFDSGGISLKPGTKMSEMKFDMSGGAAVLEATGAIARLGLPLRVVTVIGATENMPSGHALKPGDIVRAKTGTTIEIINTDAEGRLVLADCLAHAVDLGAERIVDFATLTGAIVTTFGDTHAGLFGSDDAWCAAVAEAGARAGELVWRLPLHADYAKAIEGRYGDIVNAVETRKAGSIVAAEFLRKFTGGRAVGARRHRRHRLGHGQGLRAQGRHGLRGAADPGARRGARRASLIASWTAADGSLALGLLLLAVYAATLSIPATAGEQLRGRRAAPSARRPLVGRGRRPGPREPVRLAPVARVQRPGGADERHARARPAARAAGRRDAAGDLARVRARRRGRRRADDRGPDRARVRARRGAGAARGAGAVGERRRARGRPLPARAGGGHHRSRRSRWRRRC